MWWQQDDLADKLIANNAARPRPGMEKPNMTRVAMTGWNQRKKVTAATDEASTHGPADIDDTSA